MKDMICAGVGLAGGFVASTFGGWNTAMATLLIFMAIDYVSGLVVAGVFHASAKSSSGMLESRAGFKGLCRKCMAVLFVLIAHRLDMALGVSYVRDTVVIGFIANELMSIVENAGLMGLPLPAVVTGAIDVLNRQAGEQEETDHE